MHHHLHVEKSILAGEKKYIHLGRAPASQLSVGINCTFQYGYGSNMAVNQTTELVILSIYRHQFQVAR